MRKVIDRHLYDTDTARRLARWEASCSPTDFSWSAETLYRTKAGLYFLHGEGGPRTIYAQAGGDMWAWGERIIPVSEEAAMQWTEEHCDGDTYERIFGGPEGDSKKFTIALSARDAARFEEIKKTSGRSYTDLLAGRIRDYEPGE